MEKSSRLPIVTRLLFMMMCQNEKIAENSKVEKIRVFFNKKTNYLRADKLSQVYIAAKLTEKEAAIYQLSLSDLRLMFQAYCIA
jgi:hypothetical protein